VREHLTPGSLQVRAMTGSLTCCRPWPRGADEHFYDDVLLLDAAGDFIGLVYVRELVRLQTTLLVGNIAELEARRPRSPPRPADGG